MGMRNKAHGNEKAVESAKKKTNANTHAPAFDASDGKQQARSNCKHHLAPKNNILDLLSPKPLSNT
jgi:hypothetical protein